jgi:hypothetical protein
MGDHAGFARSSKWGGSNAPEHDSTKVGHRNYHTGEGWTLRGSRAGIAG